MKNQYLDGFDYEAIHARARDVIDHPKRLKKSAVEKYLRHFETKCAGSKRTIEEAATLLPGGIQHNLANNHPFALNITKGDGAYLYDVDGNRYIDFLNAAGVTILGNNYPPIREKVIETLNSAGYLTGLYHEYEYELARLIHKYYPSVEKFRMLGSGTEACIIAIRLARAFSGKKYIVKIQGCYHGWSDQMVYDITAIGTKGKQAVGIPEECVMYTQAVMPNDIDALERQFIANENEGGTAAFIVEACGQDSGALPTTREYHKRVRELCTKYNVLLIYDEVVTAFRIGMSGAQGYFGTKPDITVFGKIIAGGFPSAGGVGGRGDILELLAAGFSYKGTLKVLVGGTLTANPISCVAGITAITELERTGAHEKMAYAADRFIHDLVDLSNKYEIPALIFNQQSILHIDLCGLQHITSFGVSPDDAAGKRTEANQALQEYAMALAAEGLIVAGACKTYMNLQTVDVMDQALEIYERVFSQYE
ncbi:MAG: aminotransferase class III-fold pyridoxal phosphate-dependent enzyme [Synergistaceae bacterium]|nr:aminotransferase class III-fold pyridoxal phosphate-dependent enzyme [Synergistaceae bacterium]